jgi:hypothetical protein
MAYLVTALEGSAVTDTLEEAPRARAPASDDPAELGDDLESAGALIIFAISELVDGDLVSFFIECLDYFVIVISDMQLDEGKASLTSASGGLNQAAFVHAIDNEVKLATTIGELVSEDIAVRGSGRDVDLALDKRVDRVDGGGVGDGQEREDESKDELHGDGFE